MKKIALLALTACLSLQSLAVASEVPQEQRAILAQSWDPKVITQGELFDDLDTWSMSPSQIQMSYEDAMRDGYEHDILCKGVEDLHCVNATRMHVRAYLEKCSPVVTLYCIEDFYAISKGVQIKGEYLGQYPSIKLKGQFDEDKKYLLPAGKSAGIWRLPGLVHNGNTDTYWINAQLFGGLARNNAAEKFNPMEPYNLWSSVSAVSEIELPGAKPVQASDWGGGDGITRPAFGSNQQCLVVGVEKCLIAWPLNEEITYVMKIKMHKPLSTWMHGRINNPEVAVNQSKDGSYHLKLQGNPVKVPTLFAITPWSEASAKIKNRFGSKPSGCCGNGEGSWYESAGRNQKSDEMVSDLNMWLPYVQDRASASPTYWIIRSASWGENVDGRCISQDSVSGIVTTNATAYTSGAPVFNKKTMSLDYKVASPHFNQDGEINVGTYNLQINSMVARCIYGFTSAPVSATVSVISSNGEKQVATTTVKESNGWIYLKAAGFTYSSPTVRIILSQKKSVKKSVSR